MNRRQAEAIVELAQDGFAEEALLLARAFNGQEGSEVVAVSQYEFVKASVLKVVNKVLDHNLLVLVYRIIKAFFGKSVDEKALQRNWWKLKNLLNILGSLLAIAIFLMLFQDVMKKERARSEFRQYLGDLFQWSKESEAEGYWEPVKMDYSTRR
jgi:hypothetical protein